MATPETNSKEKVNIRIRVNNGPETDFEDKPATEKYFFGSNYRPLLPGEVIKLPKSYVDELLRHEHAHAYIEVVEDEPTVVLANKRKFRSGRAQAR